MHITASSIWGLILVCPLAQLFFFPVCMEVIQQSQRIYLGYFITEGSAILPPYTNHPSRGLVHQWNRHQWIPAPLGSVRQLCSLWELCLLFYYSCKWLKFIYTQCSGGKDSWYLSLFFGTVHHFGLEGSSHAMGLLSFRGRSESPAQKSFFITLLTICN